MKNVVQRIGVPRAAFLGFWVAAVIFVASAGGGGGCYDPKVTPGTLHCAAVPLKQCPDGFTCLNGLCYSGEGGKAGGGGAGGGGGTGGTCAGAIAPLCPVDTAAPAGCDPVCQRNCPCGQRCAFNGSSAACVAVPGTKKIGEVCHPKADDCVAGAVCQPETCGTGLGRCLRFCREATAPRDCGAGVVCGTPVRLADGTNSGLRACNLTEQTPACDPIANTGCPDPSLACYATGPTTICECPGTANLGAKCTFNADCAAGFTCVNAGGASTCHKTCKVAADCGGDACMLQGAFGSCP